MAGEKNRQWLLRERPDGLVDRSHFTWTEAEVPPLEDGQFLVRNLVLSFDPTQRGWLNEGPGYVPPVQIGEVMRAGSVGQVIDSRHPDFRVGDLVQGAFGWQDYAVSDGRGLLTVSKVPPGLPLTNVLSIYGITGLTAYFGMLDVGRPKGGDVVLVSGAAGATGSVAGQIAKIEGCRVVGIAGGPEKCSWLVDEAHFDAAVDYKNDDVAARLDALCPKGIDVYFDNVGGEILDHALARIRRGARVVLCGGISSGYGPRRPAGPRNYMMLVVQRARMEGFLILDYIDRFPEGVQRLAAWVREGRITFQEDVEEGLENAPETLARLFTGKNVGKQLLRIAEPSLPTPS